MFVILLSNFYLVSVRPTGWTTRITIEWSDKRDDAQVFPTREHAERAARLVPAWMNIDYVVVPA